MERGSDGAKYLWHHKYSWQAQCYVSGGEDLEESAIKLAAAFDSQQSVAWNARKAWKAALVHFRTNDQLYAALKDICPFTIGIHDIPSLELLRDKLEEMKQQYDVKLKIAKATKVSNKEEVKRLVQEQKKLAAAATKDALHKRRVADKAAKDAEEKANRVAQERVAERAAKVAKVTKVVAEMAKEEKDASVVLPRQDFTQKAAKDAQFNAATELLKRRVLEIQAEYEKKFQDTLAVYVRKNEDVKKLKKEQACILLWVGFKQIFYRKNCNKKTKVDLQEKLSENIKKNPSWLKQPHTK